MMVEFGKPFHSMKVTSLQQRLLLLIWVFCLTLTGSNHSPIQHTVQVQFTCPFAIFQGQKETNLKISYMGFLPGPKKVGLERINNYLAPIINECLDLWKGWRIPKTYEHFDGLDIKAALIIGSSDTLVTRKLFGHRSAVMKCNRCEKCSTYSADYKKNYYGGGYVARPA